MKHEAICTCGTCRKLDKRHTLDEGQLGLFGQVREQHAPTEGEALAALFKLAGKDAAYANGGQRMMML